MQLLGRHHHSPPQCPVLSPSCAPPPLQLALPSPSPVIWVGRGGGLRVAPAPEMSTRVATAGLAVASLRTEPSTPTSGALPFPVPMGSQPPAVREHRQSSGFILRPSPDRCKRSALSCHQGTARRQTPPVYRGAPPPRRQTGTQTSQWPLCGHLSPWLREGQGSWADGGGATSQSLLLKRNVGNLRVCRNLFFRQELCVFPFSLKPQTHSLQSLKWENG